MKIVHVVWGLEVGGIETMLVNIANAQAELGHRVHIFVINDLVSKDIVQGFSEDVSIHYLRRKKGSRNPWPIVRLNIKLICLNPDIIHLHRVDIARYVLPLFIGKSCTTFHINCGALGDSMKYAKINNHLIGVTQAVADEIQQMTGQKSIAISNGINTAKIKKRNINQSNQGFRIVQVGRLDHNHKGQDVLIYAIKILRDKGLDVYVDFIGDGPSHQYLESLTDKVKLSGCITFLGNKSQKYIFDSLCNYNLAVQPSRFEGFGLTVAEAMAANVPVLVSDVPQLLEVIDYGKAGYSFSNGDPCSCADMIESIMHNCDESVTGRALKRVENVYDVKVTACKYLDEYCKVISH